MEIDVKDISHLLKLVSSYEFKRMDIEKVYEESGIRYNIFDVLKLSTSEVRLHSSIIASLLCSDNHGAKNAFLKEFLRIPSLRLDDSFLDCSKASVEVEKYIGPRTETTGGRIDLFLSDGNNSLIIENKIYAYDQKNQLLRYHNFEQKGVLIYLTLYGEEPSKGSIGELNVEDIRCLSYKDDIIPWLSRCTQLAANLPYVRETINQYINTLKQLTNSYMTANNDVIKLIGQLDNIGAAFAVRNNLDAAVNNAMNDFLDKLKKKLSNDLPIFKCITEEQGDWLSHRYMSLQFEHNDWKDIELAVEFDGTYLSSMAIGLLKKSHCEDIRKVDGAEELAKRLNYIESNDSWFWGYPNEPCLYNWYNAESVQMLLDGEMVNWFIDTLRIANEQSKGLTL